MKTATLIAVIAVIINILLELYFMLISYKLLDYNEDMSNITRPLFMLSNIGMLVFFIMLYQKQTK